MASFMTRRLLQTVLVALGATLILYASVFTLPGDPIRALYGFTPPPPAELEAVRASYHLDEPFLTQYRLYLGRLLSGDLGVSYQGFGVRRAITANAIPSLSLLGAVLVLQLVVGAFAGWFATVRRRTLAGGLVRGATLLFIAFPIIALPYVLQAVFGLKLGWLPYSGDFAGWRSYVLPTIALAATFTAYVARMTESSLSTELRAEYMRVALAKGMTVPRAIGVHAVRNVLVPVVTLTAGNIGQMLTALIVVEGVFNIPGLGQVVFQAVRNQDTAVVVNVVTLLVIIVTFVTMLADYLCALIDPRYALR